MYYGNGFTFSDLYIMPVYLRKFYLKKLTEMKKKESDQMKDAQKTNQRPMISNQTPYKK
jgi:ribonuclease HIII